MAAGSCLNEGLLPLSLWQIGQESERVAYQVSVNLSLPFCKRLNTAAEPDSGRIAVVARS